MSVKRLSTSMVGSSWASRSRNGRDGWLRISDMDGRHSMASVTVASTEVVSVQGEDAGDDIVKVVDEFVDSMDWQQMSREAFLGARFDAGLAWVSFPDGCGGRGWNRRLQRDVERRFKEHGTPSPTDYSPIGFGSIGPTVMAHG